MDIFRRKHLFLFGILALLLFSFFYTDSTNYKIYAEEKSVISVQQKEEETFKKELSLVLPDIIDDPNYKIVFKNPSKEPVDLLIDGKTYKKIKSPFKLPNLRIGKHTLVFKYTNKEGVPRVLTLNVTVVPRPPIVADDQKKIFDYPEPVILYGSAIPNSTVLVIVDSDTISQVNVDSSGNWHTELPKLKPGKHKIMLFTVKDGITNTTPTKLEIEYNDQSSALNIETNQKENNNSYLDQIKNSISVLLSNKDFILYSLVGLGTVIFAFLVLLIRKYLKQKEQEKSLADLLGIDNKDIVDILEQNNEQEKQNLSKNKSSSGGKKSNAGKKSNKKTTKKNKSKNKQGGKSDSGSKAKNKKKFNKEEKVEKSTQSKEKKDKSTVDKKTDNESGDIRQSSRKVVEKKQDDSKVADKVKEEVPQASDESSDDIQVKKIKVSLTGKGKKVMSKEEFLKQFKDKSN